MLCVTDTQKLHMRYRKRAISAVLGDRLAHALAKTVESIISAKQTDMVAHLDMLSGEALAQISGWNATPVPRTLALVHALVAQQVRRGLLTLI